MFHFGGQLKMLHKTQKEKMSAKKKAAVITGSIVGVLAVLCLAGFFIINSYISKVKYDPGTKSLTFDIDSEPADTTSDSPQSEIDALNKEIEENFKNNSTPLMYDKDVFNILLIGCDTRKAGGSGRSDSMILVSINKKTSKIVMTSLLRDIYVKIPGIAQGNRLNAAYAYGGASLLLNTIEQNFKIKVDKYIAVDFFSFMDIIDKIGGVSVNISDAEVKVANNYIAEINHLKGLPADDGKFTSSGMQTMTGKQALGFSRIRYVGNGDFGRTDRQRLVMNQVFSKLKTLNFIQLNDLLNTILPETTTNLSKGEFFSLILAMPTYSKYSIDSWHVPTNDAFSYLSIRKMSVLGIDFQKTIAEMRERIYN
jgi:polyisoprenyl-teichoic acid--peptidoglycan teichoic acid transferase